VTITPGQSVTVLLVDDHAVVREGYRRLLERAGDIAVVGEAGDADSAYASFRELDPDLVVMDITLPGASGIEAMRRMLAVKHDTRVLMFSMHEEPIFAKRALRAGAYGYVTKASAPSVLVEAVHTVAGGRKYLSSGMARELALGEAAEGDAVSDTLSVREFDVLRLLVRGLSVHEIAQTLGLNSKTVANHQSVIRQKLQVDTAIALLRKADSMGITPGD
jgi:DNA-binding NarL/FixJ family response regulator